MVRRTMKYLKLGDIIIAIAIVGPPSAIVLAQCNILKVLQVINQYDNFK